MDDFVRTMHTKSGLLDEIAASTTSLEEAGAATLDFIRSHVPKARTVPLAGNSIGTDRRFLASPAAGHRGVPALPLGRRLDGQRAGPALVPGGHGGRPGQVRRPPGHGRHP